MRWFPSEPPREWRASIGLLASIAGSAALTVLTAWLVWILWRGGWSLDTATERISILGKVTLLALSGSLVVLVSLGFAINRCTVKLTREGFEASGGQGEPDA
jgi:hypothetical protein